MIVLRNVRRSVRNGVPGHIVRCAICGRYLGFRPKISVRDSRLNSEESEYCEAYWCDYYERASQHHHRADLPNIPREVIYSN